MRYFGFENFAQMVDAFGVMSIVSPVPPVEGQILFASYSEEDYEGDAIVILQTEEGLFEVHGSHCSCYGLEGQWDPRPVTWPALKLRVPGIEAGSVMKDHTEEARLALLDLIDQH